MGTQAATITVTTPQGSTSKRWSYTHKFATWEPATLTLAGFFLIPPQTNPDRLHVWNLTSGGQVPGGQVYGGVQAIAPQTSGQYYWEVTYNTVPVGTSGGVAFGPYQTVPYEELAVIGGLPPSLCPAGIIVGASGEIFAYGNDTGFGIYPANPTVVGDTFGIAVDLDLRLIWFQIVAGPDVDPSIGWNGNGGNPATGAGGIAIQTPSNVLMSPTMVFGGESFTNTFQIFANFGSVPYDITLFGAGVPTGFKDWPLQ